MQKNKMKLKKAREKDTKLIDSLFQLFAHDMSATTPIDVNEFGRFPDVDGLDLYTDSDLYISHIILVDEKVAGLSVVRHDDINYLRHFFILRKYRNKGLAYKAASELFDLLEGSFRISTMDHNENAIGFWERTLDKYTKNNYKKMRRVDDKGPQYEFYK